MRAYDLTVTGSLTVSGSTTLTGDITYDDLTATGNIITTGANKVISGSSTSTGSFGALHINGKVSRVGIGTTAPDYTLDVAGNAGFDEYIYHNGDADTYIRFAPDLVNLVAGGFSAIKYEKSAGKIIINNTNEDVDFHVMAEDNSDLLTTDAANNRVGVNTTTPPKALTVTGDISGSGDLNINGNITGSSVSASTGKFTTVDIDGGSITGITDLAVADGGTGAGTFTDGGVLLGSGTSAITAMSVLADSEMIVGDGSTDPVAESGATLRTSIGVGTADNVVFSNVSGAAATFNSATVKGTLTAEEVHTTFISSSISVSTGSNVFGDAQTDIQQFTGSIHQSGSSADHYFQTGKLGIGTSTPDTHLEVKGSGDQKIQIRSTDEDAFMLINGYTSKYAELGFLENGANRWYIAADYTDSDKLKFGLDPACASTKMTITNTGNVGIGSTSPGSELDIANNSSNTAAEAYLSTYSAGGYSSGLILRQSRNNTIGSHTVVQNGQYLSHISSKGSDGSNWMDSSRISFQTDGTIAAGTVPGRICFHTSGSDGFQERMRLDSSGNVGIGQTDMTTYAAKLYVKDDPSNLRFILHNSAGSGERWELNSASGGTFYLGNASVNAITITSAGAATFAGS